MSSKINILYIINGHLKTLSDTNGKTSIVDYFTFFLIPTALAIVSMASGFNLKSGIISLLVNFGAIFTALLLPILVLAYDQESKLDYKHSESIANGRSLDPLYEAKKKFLNQLYFNISYSIISSIFLIGICFGHSIFEDKIFKPIIANRELSIDLAKYVFTPLAIFATANLMLTILMVVKRLHTLLTLKLAS